MAIDWRDFLGVWDAEKDGNLKRTRKFEPPITPPNPDDPPLMQNGGLPYVESSPAPGVWEGIPAWARVIFILGPLSVIALGTVWNSEMRLSDTVEHNKIELATIRSQMAEHGTRTEEKLNAALQVGRETNRLLRIICVGQQTTTEGRSACQGRED